MEEIIPDGPHPGKPETSIKPAALRAAAASAPSMDNFQEARRLLKELVVLTTYDDPLGQFMLMQVRERADKFLKMTETR